MTERWAARLWGYHGGYRPSPSVAIGTHGLDEMPRFGLMRAAGAKPPLAVDNSSLLPTVFDQGQCGSCVGHATAEALWGEMIRAWRASGSVGDPPVCPSRLWNYWLGRVEDGNQAHDVGTMPSSVFAALDRVGLVPEPAWPYSDRYLSPSTREIGALTRVAYDQRLLTGTARIVSSGAQRLADIRAALTLEYLVVFGTMVDRAFEDLAPCAVWPGCGNDPLGGHCMVLTGYDEQAFRARNSWGDSWADGGSGWIDQRAVEQFDDIWIVAAAPPYTGTV